MALGEALQRRHNERELYAGVSLAIFRLVTEWRKQPLTTDCYRSDVRDDAQPFRLSDAGKTCASFSTGIVIIQAGSGETPQNRSYENR